MATRKSDIPDFSGLRSNRKFEDHMTSKKGRPASKNFKGGQKKQQFRTNRRGG